MGKENDTVDKTCGKRLREARKAAKLNRAELGEKVGYSEVQIGRFERGDNRIPMETAEKFEKVFRIQADYFTGKSDCKTKAEEISAQKEKDKQLRAAIEQSDNRTKEFIIDVLSNTGFNAVFCQTHEETVRYTGIPFHELIHISEKLYHVLSEEHWWEKRYEERGWLIETASRNKDIDYCWIAEYDMDTILFDALSQIEARILDTAFRQKYGYSPSVDHFIDIARDNTENREDTAEDEDLRPHGQRTRRNDETPAAG